jgi:predicted restriction endonuclease
MSKRLWTKKELIIAMNLYCKLSFGQFHSRNPTIIKIAEKLDRTPSSLAMKLTNLAAIDPYHKNRGIKGLKSYSKKDKQIWDEFHKNWDAMVIASEEELASLLGESDNKIEENELETSAIFQLKETEIKTTIKARRGQEFFRQTVLSSYNNSCCITGNPIPELLVASHILPWSKYPKERLNPKNGLCLAKTQDAAFDRGLISFDENYRLIISPYLDNFLPNNAIEINFLNYKNKPIILPVKFQPEQEFISIHRETIFQH